LEIEVYRWIKAIFAMLTVGVLVLLVILAKVSEIRNILKGKGGHL